MTLGALAFTDEQQGKLLLLGIEIHLSLKTQKYFAIRWVPGHSYSLFYNRPYGATDLGVAYTDTVDELLDIICRADEFGYTWR